MGVGEELTILYQNHFFLEQCHFIDAVGGVMSNLPHDHDIMHLSLYVPTYYSAGIGGDLTPDFVYFPTPGETPIVKIPANPHLPQRSPLLCTGALVTLV